MTGESLPLREAIRIMAESAETSTGPEVTIAGTAAKLVEVQGYAPDIATRLAREAFETWVESYEAGIPEGPGWGSGCDQGPQHGLSALAEVACLCIRHRYRP
ncbi:hypothetical protein H5395_17710 [Paracoccus sp. MC1854]|uniref:hypothetical protein n=1 Tax=Paracoccus sp. MC1854 TaxID=2760306 RepID=UPI0016034E3C|nr:hypothetical protein [Paracoccus sp. MC1854]MBB1493286.1 hypothetical protein [Paracoccus sp. MC1854]